MVVDFQELYRFLICWYVPEIFAIKFESCQKSRKILDDFLPSQIFGGRHCKIVPILSPLFRGTSTENVSWG